MKGFTNAIVAALEVTAGPRTIIPLERVSAFQLGPLVVVRRRPWAVTVTEGGQESRRHIHDATRMVQAGIVLAGLLSIWALSPFTRRPREAQS